VLGGSATFGFYIIFAATATGKTITSGGKSIGAATFSGIGGGWTLQDAFVPNVIAHTAGTLNTNGFSVDCTNGGYSSTGNLPRTLTLGASTVSIANGPGGGHWTISGINFTINCGTSIIVITHNTTSSFTGGGHTYYELRKLNAGSNQTFFISGANTFTNLTFTTTSSTAYLTFTANQIVTGTLTITGPAGGGPYFNSSVVGTQRSVTAAAVSLSNTTFQDINAVTAFTAPLGCNNLGNNTNITFNTSTLYWIGGTGNWPDGTHWSTSSGGVAANVIPGSTNSVIFDASSNVGTGTFTVTVNATSYCNDFSTGGAGGALDGAMTLTFNAFNIYVYGSFTAPATNFGTSFTAGGFGLIFSATSTGKTITTQNITFSGVAFDGVGGGWTLQDNMTCSIFNVVGGAVDTNGKTVTIGSGIQSYLISNGSKVRSLTLGASTINISGYNVTTNGSIDFSGTNFTFNAGTSQINFNSGSIALVASGYTFYNVTISTAFTLYSTNTFNNLSHVSPGTAGVSALTLAANQTVTGTFTTTSTSQINRLSIVSSVGGTQRTLTAAVASLTNTDFFNIVGAGAASWTGTGIGDYGNNSNITFTAAKTVYWNLAGAQSWQATGWATSSGGTPALANFPLAQDTAIFDDVGSVTGTISNATGFALCNIDMSARTSAMTLTFGGYCYGNLINGSGVTTTGTAWFNGSGTKQIKGNGKTFDCIVVMGIGTNALTLQLQDNVTLSSSSTIYHRYGTLDLNNFTLTAGAYLVDVASTKVLAFGSTGVVKVNGSTNVSGIPINISTPTGFSYTGTSNFTLDNNTANTITAVFQGLTEAQAMNLNVISGTYTFVDNFTVVKNLDFTGFLGTLSSSTSRTIYGNLTLSAGMTTGIPGGTSFGGTSGSKTITCNGKTFTGALSFNGAGSTWTLQDAMGTTAASTLTLSAGTLNTNNQTVTTGLFSTAGAVTRVLTLGSSTFNLSGTGTVWNISTVTGLTFTANTSSIVFTDTSATTKTFAGNALTYYNLTIGNVAGAATYNITGINTFNNITATSPTATGTNILSFAANQTISGTLTTTAGGAADRRVQLSSSVAGTQRTLTAAAVSFSSSTNFQDIIAAGVSSPWTATLGDINLGNNTNITFDTSALYWIGGTGNWTDGTKWSASSGGAAANVIPGPTNSVIFDANSDAGGIFGVALSGVGLLGYCNDFTASSLDFTMTFTLAGVSTVLNVYGSLSFPATNFAVTMQAVSVLNFVSTSTGKTITTNGKQIDASIAFNGLGGGWTLSDALTFGSISVTAGTFNTGNQTLTSTGGRPDFYSTGALVRAINLGSSTVLTYGMSISGTNLTFNAGTSQINLGQTNSWGVSIPLTFYNFTCLGPMAPQSSTVFTGGVTFNDLTLTAPTSAAMNLTTVSSNTTINGTFSVTGGGGTVLNRIWLKSSVQGTQRTITCNAVSGITNVDFQDIVIAGAAAPISGTSLGNGGNNSGITFTAAKTVYWNLAGATNWFTSTGWATTNNGTPAVANFPLGQDTAVFTEAGAAGTVNAQPNILMPNITFADGVSNRVSAVTLYFGNGGVSYYFVGDFTGCSALTVGNIGSNNFLFTKQGVQTVTSGGASLLGLNVAATSGCNFTLGDNCSFYSVSVIAGATLTINGKTLTINGTTNNSGLYLTGAATVAFGSSGGINISSYGSTIFTGSATQIVTGTPVINCTYAAGVGTRTISALAPTEANAISFNITAGNDIVAFSGSIKNLDLTGFVGTFSNFARTLYGNANFALGPTYTAGANATTFGATSGTQTITSGSQYLDFPITVSGVGGTTQLVDALTLGIARTLTLTAGTFNANNLNVSVGLFSSSNANVRTLTMGSGTWTLSGTGAVWTTTTSTNFTLTPGTSTILLSDVSTTARTFAGGSKIYNNLTIGGATGTSTLTFTGSNTFNTLYSTKTVAHTLSFTASTTNTFTTFNVNGTLGNLVTIQSATAANHTLAKAGGGTVTVNYMSISRSTATPAITWLALNSTDGGNNTGWSFGAFPPSSTFFLLF
jgi:hypothetical protein